MQIFTDNVNYRITPFGSSIVLTEYLNDAVIDLEKIVEIKQTVKDHVKNNSFISIVDMTGITGAMTSEAKEFIATDLEINNMKKVELLLVNNQFIRILVSTYLKVFKPKVRTIAVFKMADMIQVLNEYHVEASTIDLIVESIQNKKIKV